MTRSRKTSESGKTGAPPWVGRVRRKKAFGLMSTVDESPALFSAGGFLLSSKLADKGSPGEVLVAAWVASSETELKIAACPLRGGRESGPATPSTWVRIPL